MKVYYKETPRRIDAIAGIVIILTGIVLVCFWYHCPEFRAVNVADSFVDANQFINGANFKELGFWELRFTADYAVGPKQYHPFYYIHNGPLSEIINGIYQKLGLVKVEWQRLLCIVWTLLGYVFFYAMLRLLAGPLVALWSLIIAVSNPFVIYWGDNLFFSHQWMFIYASFYFLLRYIRKSSLVSFFIAWSSFFFATLCNYELIPLIAIFALGLKLFKLESISRQKLFIFLSAPLFAFCLRNLLIIWAVGYQIWYRDLIEILLHRTFGIKTSLMEMYKHIPVIMWDEDPKIPPKFLWLLYIRLENLYGYGWSPLLIALSFPFLRRRLLPQTAVTRIYRLILLFFIMGVGWYLLFPQHTSAHFHHWPMLFFLPFSSLLWSCVLVGLWQNITRLPVKIICSAVILCSITAARIINFVPPKPFAGIEALRRYEGRILVTHCVPTLVEYYTKAPAAFCASEKHFKDLLQGKYKFFLRDDKLKPPQPEFFFSVYDWDGGRLAKHFSLVERGPDYAIYRLQGKIK
jgi:hypothetical protein